MKIFFGLSLLMASVSAFAQSPTKMDVLADRYNQATMAPTLEELKIYKACYLTEGNPDVLAQNLYYFSTKTEYNVPPTPAETYLVLHWRMYEYSEKHGPNDIIFKNNYMLLQGNEPAVNYYIRKGDDGYLYLVSRGYQDPETSKPFSAGYCSK